MDGEGDRAHMELEPRRFPVDEQAHAELIGDPSGKRPVCLILLVDHLGNGRVLLQRQQDAIGAKHLFQDALKRLALTLEGEALGGNIRQVRVCDRFDMQFLILAQLLRAVVGADAAEHPLTIQGKHLNGELLQPAQVSRLGGIQH